MSEYIFGASILENVTTGMYRDSRVIYREYIQNACDQIDKAEQAGILNQNEGKIRIWIDSDARTISIEDNATGIKAADFQRILGNIADSEKKISEDKGFRGIGRLSGLAYCKKVIFTSSAKGENIISMLTCDAQKMRKMIVEHEQGKKHRAIDILKAINTFESRSTEDTDSHFFKVELIDINKENTDLLDFEATKDYLSFVAPVPYQNTFYYRNDVYKHAAEIGYRIDEYSIKLNGEQVFKKYIADLKEYGKKYDEIFGVVFHDFYTENGELFAWLWYGETNFTKAIPHSKASPSNPMRGLRLRKNNIQIGSENTLDDLFSEERGNNYFVGEVFAVSKDLIPNSQRDYFNETDSRNFFKKELGSYFCNILQKIYRDGSDIGSAFKKIDGYENKKAEFVAKDAENAFVSKEDRESFCEEVQQAEIKALNARKKLELKKAKAAPDSIVSRIIDRTEKKRASNGSETLTPPVGELIATSDSKKKVYRANKLSALPKRKQKLVGEIFEIIKKHADKKTAEMLIEKIESELK